MEEGRTGSIGFPQEDAFLYDSMTYQRLLSLWQKDEPGALEAAWREIEHLT
jgi:hypothetical protein